jgi:hypothetical protein
MYKVHYYIGGTVTPDNQRYIMICGRVFNFFDPDTMKIGEDVENVTCGWCAYKLKKKNMNNSTHVRRIKRTIIFDEGYY